MQKTRKQTKTKQKQKQNKKQKNEISKLSEKVRKYMTWNLYSWVAALVSTVLGGKQVKYARKVFKICHFYRETGPFWGVSEIHWGSSQ